MNTIGVLAWIVRGERLLRKYDHKGNYWMIADEKCSGTVNTMLRRGLIVERIGGKFDEALIAEAGLALLHSVLRQK